MCCKIFFFSDKLTGGAILLLFHHLSIETMNHFDAEYETYHTETKMKKDEIIL